MNIAIALFKNSIAPRLDISDSIIIYDINQGIIKGKKQYEIDFNLPGELFLQLLEKKVEIIICSSAPRVYDKTLSSHGIQVIYDVKGEPDVLIKKLIAGQLRVKLPGFEKEKKYNHRSVNMEVLKISKKDFNALIDKKIWEKESDIKGVIQKGSHYTYDDLTSSKDLCLDYDITLLPPKKFFQPPKEVLLKFVPKQADSYQVVKECRPVTIIGIHYYDLAAIYLMDKAFGDGEKDENYLHKRKNSLLIGIFPTKHFQYRFAKSVVRDQYYKAADLMLVDMGDDYVIEVVTDKGRQYLNHSKVSENDFSFKEIDEAKNRIKDDRKIPVPHELTPDFLEKNYDHKGWEYFGNKCFSCGSCVLVCPTCYCFNVTEEIELSLSEGRRVRVWDGCMLEDFAQVADGHNFRRTRTERFRHRIFRKGKYLPEKHQYYGCVGCGRCADACTADIAGPVKVLRYLKENQ